MRSLLVLEGLALGIGSTLLFITLEWKLALGIILLAYYSKGHSKED